MLTHKGKRVYDGFQTKTNIDTVLEELREKGCEQGDCPATVLGV